MTASSTPINSSRARNALFAFAGIYFIALLCLLPLLSLWLDEIHDLHGVRFLALSQLPAYTANDGGGVPLGYLTQFLFVKLFGFSATTGRLASAISSALACLGVGLICRQVRFRYPLIAMAIFACLPLQLRYATEARPYAQAVCLVVFCTLAFIWWLEEVTLLRCIFYLGTVIAGLYTQPFTFFIPLGHWVWLAASRSVPERRKLLPVLSGLVFTAALAFLPWYIYARQFWRRSIDAGQFHFVFGWKELSLLAHELVGAGYFGTALILSLCIFGLGRSRISSLQKWLWTALLIVSLIGPIAADAFFGYFLAIRQFIFIVPALALLSAGVSVLMALAAVLLTGDVRWFTKPREDWRAQAAALEKNLSAGVCVIFIPPIAESYFSFFNPRLKSLQCSFSSLPKTVWLAVSPYDAGAKYMAAIKRLDNLGFIPSPPPPGDGLKRPRLERFECGAK